VYYRLAKQQDALSCWDWESRVVVYPEILLRVLRMYRSMPRSRLRVFFSSSVADLDLMLVRENTGLASNSIPFEQLLHGWWGTNQSLSHLEMMQFESELRARESVGWEKYPLSENKMCLRKGEIIYQRQVWMC
jgi:hypothetical protein